MINNNILGKIKRWNKPVFDLIEMEQNLLILKDNLERLMELNLSAPFIKTPTPNTALGYLKYTIRFDYGEPKLKENESIFKKIEIGFGERGYYYDIFYNLIDLQNINEYLEKLKLFEKKIQSTIEKDLSDFYFDKREGFEPFNNQDYQESTSFELYLKNFTKDSEKLTFLMDLHEIINKFSEYIIPNENNDCIINLKYVLTNQKIQINPSYQNPEITLLPFQRFVTFELTRAEIPVILGRGINIDGLIQIINFLKS